MNKEEGWICKIDYNIFSEILTHMHKGKIEIIPDDKNDQEISDHLSKLANYSAMKEVDQMTEDEKISFARQFQEDLTKDPELKKQYNEFLLQN